MKVTPTYRLYATYNDGAGNTATYVYVIAAKANTFTAVNLWRLRAFQLSKPTTTLALVCEGTALVGGAPPAFATRTLSISVAGVCTFKDAFEAVKEVRIAIAISDTEEHPYTLMSIMGLSDDRLYVSSITVNALPAKDSWIATPANLIADGVGPALVYTPSVSCIAAAVIPNAEFVIAETDLVTREYTGMYMEVAAKGIISLIQAVNREYAGLAAQAVAYASSGNSPVALELPLAIHSIPMGATV